MDFQNVELLAPAGSFESLQAAIHAGADSIYFGVEQLNMRARSSINFSIEQMQEIREITRKAGVKAYLTLNTVLYDHDMRLMKVILQKAKEANIDAVIVSDMAAILYAREIGLPVHISTQLSVSNFEAVKFYAQFADTIVLARELTLPMIQKICQKIDQEDIRGASGNRLKIEIFAHGALCIAISGRCGMSLYTSNASANRGACKQNCRKPYVVTDKETGMELEIDNEYIMSPKDICTIDFLDEVLVSGVRVLKLEGRGRSPDYVDEVTRCYREAIEALQTGTYNDEKIAKWRERLSSVYNRGLSDGYYLGRKQGWSKKPDSQATEKKVYCGKVVHYFPKAKVAQIQLEANDLAIQQKILITGVTTGVVRDFVREIRNEDDEPLSFAGRTSLITIPMEQLVRRGDKVYRLDPVFQYAN
ncbi:MAG: U32 family peptidase [Candidatus Hydrogenedentota bacterium]|nr:MAG: U32 family peptidase [Candidatus Hydrogenedentota bacterium]